MLKTKLLSIIALTPVLIGGCKVTEVGTAPASLSVTSLPKCTADQYLVYRSGTVRCETAPRKLPPLPDCKSSGQLLVRAVVSGISQYICAPKGSIQFSNTDQTTIYNLQNQLTMIGAQVKALGTGSRTAARTFRGLTTNTYNGNLGGAKGAAAVCGSLFGAGAAMCDIYSVYGSLASGKIDGAQDIAGAWVYQEAWTSAFGAATADVTAGLGDNCAGYNSAAAAGGLAGTKFSFVAATGDANNRVPKFYSNTTCDTMLPIACCQ